MSSQLIEALKLLAQPASEAPTGRHIPARGVAPLPFSLAFMRSKHGFADPALIVVGACQGWGSSWAVALRAHCHGGRLEEPLQTHEHLCGWLVSGEQIEHPGFERMEGDGPVHPHGVLARGSSGVELRLRRTCEKTKAQKLPF